MSTEGRSVDEIVKKMYDGALESVSQLEHRMETIAERPPLAIRPGVFLHNMDAKNAIETTLDSVQAKKARCQKFLWRKKKKEEKEKPPSVKDFLRVNLVDPDDPDNPDGSSLHILDYLAKYEWIQQNVSGLVS